VIAGAIAVVLSLAACADDPAPQPSSAAEVVQEVAFPSRADVMAGDTAFLLVERDDTEEHVGPSPDDRPPRVIEILPSGDGMVERTLPPVSGKDLSAPSAIQLPDGGWLFVGVECPPDPDALSPACRDGNQPPPIVRRFDPDERTWSDVGTVPAATAGGTPELVGLDGDVAVLRTIHGEGSGDWRYWTIDVEAESYRELWGTPAATSAWLFSRSDCAAEGRLVVVDESDGATRQELTVVDIPDGEVRMSGALDVDHAPIARVVCDEDGVSLVGWSRGSNRPVAFPLREDGTLGPVRRGQLDHDVVGGLSNRRTVVFEAQVGDDPSATTVIGDVTQIGPGVTERPPTSSPPPPPPAPDETLELAIFDGDSWRAATVTGSAIDFVHPDLTGERVLLEHRDDRWTIASTG
jgi:hypothetical protein